MKKTITSIVQTPKGAFYSMQHSDERFNTPNYKQVAEIASIKVAQISSFNKKKCRVVTLTNGQQFEVFTDWSAREKK